MEQIGWSLVDDGGAELQYWGDSPGQCAGMPSFIRLPSGDDVHCPQAGQIQEWKLVPRHYAYSHSAAGPTFATDKVVVTGALAALKSKLKTRVDDDAETVRLRYITAGVGQSMTYLEKHNQAIAVEALGETAANALSEQDRAAQFPTLAASVGIEAPTLWACAQLVILKYEAWAALSHVIERTRLLGKKSISDASDAAAAQAAYEAIAWPQ